MTAISIEADMKPRIAEPELLNQLLRLQEAVWPRKLKRFSLFKRTRDGDDMRYRAVCFDRFENDLYVLAIHSNKCPETQVKLVKWRGDSADQPFSDIMLCDESVAPQMMRGALTALPLEVQKFVGERMKVVHAFCYLDKKGQGNPHDFIFNDFVVMNDTERLKALAYVVDAAKKPKNFRTQAGRIVHRWLHFGGGDCALADLTCRMGRKEIAKGGSYSRKPGPPSRRARMAHYVAVARGRARTQYREVAVTADDLRNFVSALTTHWALAHRTLKDAYHLMLDERYADTEAHLRPSLNAFYYHARESLIARYQLRSLRNGATIAHQFDLARIGQATDLTQGVIGIADVDGWSAKMLVAALVNGKLIAIPVVVLFAVCRNSHCVLGYEIALTGENAESFRRCIASIYMDKAPRAKELGLISTEGLLHGTIDGVMVDNGSGAAEEVLAVACDEMNLWRMLPEPGRGDKKSPVESFNGTMILLTLTEETAYTRATDPLSKRLRRLKRKNPPVSVTRFEQLIVLCMQHHNLHADVRHLRTKRMEELGIGITPAEICTYLQNERIAAGIPQLTYREALTRFVPWEPRLSRDGLIYFKGYRFTSSALVVLHNQYAERPLKEDRKLWVKVKRLDGKAKKLLWLLPNGEEGILDMVDEDARRVGDASWKEVELIALGEAEQAAELAEASGRSQAWLTTGQHVNITDAARNAAQSDLGGLGGENVKAARANAKKKRDAKRGEDYLKAKGIKPTDKSGSGPIVVNQRDEVEGMDEDYAKFLAAEEARRTNPGAGSHRPAQ
ncbi:hypothetical protein [Caballeronia sp. ATUFL_M2_KS44]|uniref:hypothetical protein n=1 Tax=Caballeronia sp. ATUFL_M2_KS44 TaxID=2921767 RepID=UPI002029031C|nr:hypothetical protein [Caballeronia sp. ATUFL_M2_KS44]